MSTFISNKEFLQPTKTKKIPPILSNDMHFFPNYKSQASKNGSKYRKQLFMSRQMEG